MEKITNKKKRPLVLLAGPTAVGKTELSVKLAQKINAEIISADSMQVYKHMNIGSAKITTEEMQGIMHHLIDVLEPNEEFNVYLFCRMAKQAMEGIYARGHIPMIVGGTGFYIQALLYDVDFTKEESDLVYRNQLEVLAKEKGAEYLHEQLKQVDEKSAEDIHPNNTKRVIRALEYYHLTGKQISRHNEEAREKESPYHFLYFVLDMDRASLYERIDLRVNQMLEKGLVQEVAQLKKLGYTRDMVSMQGLGYKEILDYLSGEISLDEAVYRIKRDSRHFAKRQLTWFRRERDVTWISYDYEVVAKKGENNPTQQKRHTASEMLSILYEKCVEEFEI